ncbi:peptide/nickel transport system substrate-binding protein [Haloactinopolyspora alba]|uniref:Peptide/nickel transport system substrate-binding protein n=1 Tax=Haloactinopolyspora alba TaxID=648780 RepID=A0A2P8DVF1_9ACTN|nr:ABC transporter substrate-binding protein [Haloactinopolyspora alba]PSL01181.1 peptide/nickel transport system substrate-binding protein [Haloactinopolyspora alba]
MTRTRRQRVRTRLAAVLSAAVLAGACSGGEDVDVGGDGGGGDGGGGDGGSTGGTLIAAISAQPDQFDPHKTQAYASFQVLENVYDTLVVPDAEGQFQPSLATGWETSEDGLTWTFTLREGVTFHDGSEFDSADVVYSYNRIIDQELANAFRFASVESVEAPDPRTVVINLTEPSPALLANIGGFKGMSIIPEGAADQFDLATEAVGTGPFTFESSGAGGVTLAAYDGYWGDAPTVDGVEFQYISEPTAALTALRSGDIHWTDNVPPQDVESLQDDDQVEVGVTPSVDYWYLAMNQAREPFDNRDFRRGVAYGIDREAVTEAAKFGAATVNQTAIPQDSFWYHEYAPFEHDPQRAQDLVAGAAASTPQPMGLMVTDEYPETVQAAQIIASNLAEVGIKVNIEQESFNTWLARQADGDFDAFMLGWLGNLDPFGFYHAQHVCEGSSNYQQYCNPKVDDLLTRAASETDREARKALYDQAAELIVDDVSYLYLYNPDVVQAWAPGLEGYEIRADKAINFESVRLPE